LNHYYIFSHLDIEFIEIVEEKDLKHIKIPTLQSILKSPTIETNTNIINNTNKTTIVPVKQDNHTANVINISSVQSQTTSTSSKKTSKQIVQSPSKPTNVVYQQPIEDMAQKTFFNISNSPLKSPNKTHFKKESNNAIAVSFKTLNNKNASNKENQSIRKVRSKSLCNEYENSNIEKNLKNSIFLNKSNSNLKAASSLNEDFANFDSNVKSKILTLANNQHQNTNLKRKLSKQGQQQQSPDRKRKRLNHE
jgi:hypothetical protein